MGRVKVSFEVRTENGVDVVDLNGQLDTFAAPSLRTELRKLANAHHYNLILNFRNVESVNSTIIGVIIAVAQQVRKRKGDIRIFGMKDDVRKVFDLVGVSRILEIFENEQEALNSFC